MRLKQSMEEFLSNHVNLDRTRLERIRSAHRTMRDKIKALDGVMPYYVSAYLQGSYALHSVVRPVEDDHEYDVDVVLALDLADEDGALPDGYTVLRWLYDQIDAIPLYKGKVEMRERCLRVQYASDGQRFHLDVLPAHQPVVDDEPIKIPRDWTESNPRGYKAWLDRVKAERCGRVRHLVRLLKYWRNLQFPDGLFAPNSMVLTTLVGRFAPTDDEFISLDEALVLTMQRIKDWLDELPAFETVVIENPSFAGENLARSWYWVEVSTFHERFRRATELAQAALDATEEKVAIDFWNDDMLFAGHCPKTLRGLGADAKAMSEAMAAGSVFVASNGRVGDLGVQVRDNRGFFGDIDQ